MLTGKQKQYLKGTAVDFSAVVQIGKEGITDNVELIKVKINQNSAENIRKAAKLLSEESGCEIIQIIGRNCILFKQKDKKSHYDLP